MALLPDHFSGGARAPDGSHWELFGEVYETNPRLQLDDGASHMVRLWRYFQGVDMGIGHLPDAGGLLDQAAIMLEAFGVMSAAERWLKDQGLLPSS